MIALRAALAFLGLAFAIEECGFWAHEWNTVAAVALLAFAALPTSAAAGAAGSRRALVWWRLVALGALLALPAAGNARSFAAALWFAGLDGAARARGSEARPWRSLALASLMFGAWMQATTHATFAWHLRRQLAEWVSAAASALGGFELRAGPTAAGLDLVVLAACAAIAAAAAGGPRRASRLVVALAASALVWFFHLRIFAALMPAPAAAPPPAGGQLDRAFEFLSSLHPARLSWILAAGLSIPVAWSQARLASAAAPVPAAADPHWSRLRIALVPAAAMVAAAALLAHAPARPAGAPLEIGLYRKGFLNWGAPASGVHGEHTVGMLGMLPDYLRSMAAEPRFVDALDDAGLAGLDALLIVNQNESFDAGTLDRLDRFVRGGGTLLVAGDHTCWRHGGVVIDEPLRPSAIRFRFDNAEFIAGGWVHGCRYWPHPASSGLDDRWNDAGSVIGASLDVRWPAVPLVVGRFGWSDDGDSRAEANAWMGNRFYDPGERIGDLVLVAAQDLGEGRIAVFGDTTAFANGALGYTWPFLARVVSWIASGTTVSHPLWREIAAAALLLGAVLATAAVHRRLPLVLAAVAAAGLVSVTAGDGILRWAGTETLPRAAAAPGAGARPAALIDRRHGGTGSPSGVKDEGHGALVINLWREGWLPFVSRQGGGGAPPDGCRLAFVAEPTRTFTAGEVREWTRWVEGGGALVVAAGAESGGAVAPLLEAFGMRIGSVPLGHNLGKTGRDDVVPQFWKAWEIEGGEPVATVWDRAAIAVSPRGAGQVLLIADSQYFRDKNLETKNGVAPGNIAFLKDLLLRVKGT